MLQELVLLRQCSADLASRRCCVSRVIRASTLSGAVLGAIHLLNLLRQRRLHLLNPLRQRRLQRRYVRFARRGLVIDALSKPIANLLPGQGVGCCDGGCDYATKHTAQARNANRQARAQTQTVAEHPAKLNAPAAIVCSPSRSRTCP